MVYQINHSYTEKKGVVRGLNYQEAPYEQAKIVRCIKGAIYSVAVDINPSSNTYGKWCGFELSCDNCKIMYIPRGYAHGIILMQDDVELQYITDNRYDYNSAKSIRFDDPEIGIDWKINGKIEVMRNILSKKMTKF